MSSMNPKVQPGRLNQQGLDGPRPAPGSVDRTRDELAMRLSDMEMNYPGAIDLAAELYVALRSTMAGKSSQLRGPRRPKYFREQLRGAHPLTLEDLARLILEAPRESAPFVRRLARALDESLGVSRAQGVALEVNEAAARTTESHAGVLSTVLRATADGDIDEVESAAIDDRIAALEHEISGLKAAKEAKRRPPAPLSLARAGQRR